MTKTGLLTLTGKPPTLAALIKSLATSGLKY